MSLKPVPRHAPATRTPRSFAGLAIAAALALTLATPGAVFAWDANSYSPADEQLLVTLTNQARAAAGLPALKVDPELADMARWRASDMIERNYFSHSIPPDGKKVFDYLTSSGYCYELAGENIGTNNYPDDVATETIQQGFMDSSGHRANILGPDWGVIGIGAYKGADGKHMWAVLFADKCGAVATPKPTPVPTPPPTAKPTATPPPTATPLPAITPVPTATARPVATPEPTPNPTATPPVVTSAPTAEPTAAPTTGTPPALDATLAPSPSELADGASPRNPSSRGIGNGRGPAGTGAPTVVPAAASAGRAAPMRVTDPPFAAGLVDRIVGDVAGGFFGN